MEYGRREELKSEPASERTTRMMRSVREILEEQGQAHLLDEENFESASEAPTVPPQPAPARTAAKPAAAPQKNGLQRPPHMQGVVNAALSKPPAPVDMSPFRDIGRAPAPAPKSRSFLARLIGR